jgi:hypothetical protein
MRTHIIVSAAIAAVVGTIASASPAVAQTDAINGAWQLNREQSDDFQQKMQEAREARGEIQSVGGSTRGRGRGRGGGRRGGGGGVSADFSDAQRAEAQEFRQMASTAIERFEFGAAQGMLAFRYPDGRSLLLKDGELTRQRVGPEGDIELEIKAEWDKEKLEVEREIRSSGKIKEVYWLNDAGQLIVDIEVEMGRGGMRVEFRRVYDRVEG